MQYSEHFQFSGGEVALLAFRETLTGVRDDAFQAIQFLNENPSRTYGGSIGVDPERLREIGTVQCTGWGRYTVFLSA